MKTKPTKLILGIILIVFLFVFIFGYPIYSSCHNHTYSDWYLVTEAEHCYEYDVYGRYCTKCGKVETKESMFNQHHNFVVTDLLTEPGLRMYICTNDGCNYVKYEVIK